MKYVKLSDLKPHPKNNYYFDDSETGEYELLKHDIEMYGAIRNPILITPNNVIISGHQRFKAYQDLGKETIPCKVMDKKFSEDEFEIILILENMSSRNASKTPNKIKLGRCLNKLCEYYHLENGNNQYTRVGNNSLPSGIRALNCTPKNRQIKCVLSIKP